MTPGRPTYPARAIFLKCALEAVRQLRVSDADEHLIEDDVVGDFYALELVETFGETTHDYRSSGRRGRRRRSVPPNGPIDWLRVCVRARLRRRAGVTSPFPSAGSRAGAGWGSGISSLISTQPPVSSS